MSVLKAVIIIFAATSGVLGEHHEPMNKFSAGAMDFFDLGPMMDFGGGGGGGGDDFSGQMFENDGVEQVDPLFEESLPTMEPEVSFETLSPAMSIESESTQEFRYGPVYA